MLACPPTIGMRAALALVVMGAAVLFAFWPTLATMAERWATDAQYSHGFLVPVFALVVLWSRREMFPRSARAAGEADGRDTRPNLWGVPLLLVGLGLRFLAGYFYFEPLDGLALLPTLVGVTLLLGGGAALRWAWPAIAFLGFMLPLPHQVEMALAQPLRRMATAASTYLLQAFGFPALSEGNVIYIDDLRLGVIDACSGLGMLFTFFALTTAAAMVIQRPLADRLVVVASAVPVALVVNIVRITLTSMAYVWWGTEVGRFLMHDFAGWLMMPMALAAVWLELWFLSHLLVETGPPAPVVVPLPRSGASLREGVKLT